MLGVPGDGSLLLCFRQQLLSTGVQDHSCMVIGCSQASLTSARCSQILQMCTPGSMVPVMCIYVMRCFEQTTDLRGCSLIVLQRLHIARLSSLLKPSLVLDPVGKFSMQAINRMQVQMHTCSLGFTGEITVWWRHVSVGTRFFADFTSFETRSG